MNWFELKLEEFLDYLKKKNVDYKIEKSKVSSSRYLTIYGLECGMIEIRFSDHRNYSDYYHDMEFVKDFENSKYWNKVFDALKRIVERYKRKVYWYKTNQRNYEYYLYMQYSNEYIYYEVLKQALRRYLLFKDSYSRKALNEALRIAKEKTGKDIRIDFENEEIIIK